MKGYVGTLMYLDQSVEVSKRCVASGKRFNVDVTPVFAIDKEYALRTLEAVRLKKASYDESWSNVGAVVGNFITQYITWMVIRHSEQPGIVLEHDAVFVDYVPDLQDQGDIINLGKPSYGKFKTPEKPGIYPMFSKTGGYIPGAHGYYVTPAGADQLIRKAKKLGASPCDIFLNKQNFPDIKELYPWPIEAWDSFTTIQNQKGCLAKHNYGEDFEVL